MNPFFCVFFPMSEKLARQRQQALTGKERRLSVISNAIPRGISDVPQDCTRTRFLESHSVAPLTCLIEPQTIVCRSPAPIVGCAKRVGPLKDRTRNQEKPSHAMTTIHEVYRNFIGDDTGPTATEYAVMLGIISGGVIVAMAGFGDGVNEIYQRLSAAITIVAEG